jgi:hypothetical protein
MTPRIIFNNYRVDDAGFADALLVPVSEQKWVLGSLMDGGGVVVPQAEGAAPIVRTRVAPSLIWAW